MPPSDASPGRLAENITHIVCALRRAGVKVGSSQLHTAIEAVEAAGFTRRGDFYYVLRSTLITRPEHFETFHQVFRMFWRTPDYIEKMMEIMLPVLQAMAPDRGPPEAAERRASEVVAFDLPHHLKADSVGAKLMRGVAVQGSPLETIGVRAPAGDWTADKPALGTLDFTLDAPARVQTAEVVTRYPHPEALSVSIDGGGGFEGVGAMSGFHGPGRDEVTWRWQGDRWTSSVRVTLRRGSEGALDLVAQRLRGELNAPPVPKPVPDAEPSPAVSPEEAETRGASPAAPPSE